MCQCSIINDDSFNIFAALKDNTVDMIFVDPPYNLSNCGTTCYAGKRVSVNKGDWDKSSGLQEDLLFHERYIAECRRLLKHTGTIWICGTSHNIFKCGYLLQKNNYHILNDIVWYKPNAAPNLSCNVFAHSHEMLIWAKKNQAHKHTYNYTEMKEGSFEEDKLKNQDKQMRSVWSIPTPRPNEKKFGKHPTQKPLALLKRIIKASTKEGDTILDPFMGSGTTALACKIIGKRNFIGIEKDASFCNLAKQRLNEYNIGLLNYE